MAAGRYERKVIVLRVLAHPLFLIALLVVAAAAAAKPQQVASGEVPEITVDLFSDFECPYCAQLAQPFHELQSKGVDGVRMSVRFRHFPLSFHANARLAHQAALAASEQGKFWEMHDLLFANQSALKRDNLLSYAKTLGLDLDRFGRDLDSDKLKKAVEEDTAEGGRLGVRGTPTFFMNGKEYSGARSFDQLKQLVQAEQRRIDAVSEITESLMSRGPASAAVTVELFADLQSPVSRPALSVLNALLTRYPSTVRLQFRNFPLAFHPQSGLAHEAAMGAARQGHFWEFVTYILEHQDPLREQDLIAYAGRLGLDETKFADLIQQHRYAPRVDADLALGASRGIRGSPVVFVNSRRIDGVPSLEALREYVEAELAKKLTTNRAETLNRE